jgi:hypothetical protein
MFNCSKESGNKVEDEFDDNPGSNTTNGSSAGFRGEAVGTRCFVLLSPADRVLFAGSLLPNPVIKSSKPELP